MARFCENCGAPLSDGVRFCGECGASAPAAPAAAPGTEAPAPETPAAFAAPQEAPVAAPPRPPREKKPLPKWVIPVVVAVVVIAGGFFAAVKILGNLHGPEKAIENFLDALEAEDAAALAACAVCADGEVEITEESAAPLFRLYAADSGFRRQVEEQLSADLELIEDDEDPSEDQLFDLRGEERFLHTAYTVTIATCRAELTANLTGTAQIEGGGSVTLSPDGSDGDGWAAGWSDKFGPDCDLAHWCTGTARDLLPGLYNVSGSVATSFGDTFTASAELRVTGTDGASAELYYECTTLELYNDNGIEAEIRIGGEVYGVIEPYQSYTVAPILASTPVEIQADAGGGPITLSCTAEDAGGYFNASFRLCTVEIRNDYAAPLTVTRGGETILEAAPNATAMVENLPAGTELTISLYAGVVNDVSVTCEDTYTSIRPEFCLTDAQLADIDVLAMDYLQACVDAFNTSNIDALTNGSLQSTELLAEMADTLRELNSYEQELEGVTVSTQITMHPPLTRDEEIRAEVEDGGILAAAIDYEISCDVITRAVYADQEPEVSNDTAPLDCRFDLRYAGGAWEISEVH